MMMNQTIVSEQDPFASNVNGGTRKATHFKFIPESNAIDHIP